MIFKKKSIVLLSLYLLFSPTKFIAAAVLPDNIIEFSLSIQHQSSDFDFVGNSYHTKMDQISINWYEPLNHYFHGGLELGNTDMSQINNPLPSAKFSTGQFVGLLFRFLPVDHQSISLRLNLNYRYNKTESTNLDQNSEFSWHEILLFSELELRPFEAMSVLLAAEYQNLEGNQRDTGNIIQITPFSNPEHLGYRFGLNYTPYPGADIGVEWFEGYKKGGGIYFKRRF